MMRPNDPRIRQTINQISHNIEIANETAQVELYNFSRKFIQPCFASLGDCLGSCCSAPCCSPNDWLQRRRRGRSLARVERNFGFYDDWDYDEDARNTIFGWGGDELDRLLAGTGGGGGGGERGRGGRNTQPGRHRRMDYGARGGRKNMEMHADERQDPTVIPSSSILGFLDRLPWGLGSRSIKYRPSAADLQEHPSRHRHAHSEEEPLVNESDDEEFYQQSADERSPRHRSSTQSSHGTNNSLSSRGDLIPSDEEQADAIPLDDSFALALDRRNTGMTFDSSDNVTSARRSASGLSFATQASSDKGRRPPQSTHSTKHSDFSLPEEAMPSLEDLQNEEEAAAAKEEQEIQRKREAAKKLARNRGLNASENPTDQTTGEPAISAASSVHDSRPSATRSTSSVSTEPFPSPAPEPLDYDEQRV